MIDPRANEATYVRPGQPHVESWFIKVNSPDSARALWLRWTLFAERGIATRAETWAIAFHRGQRPRAFKRSMPLESGMLGTPFALDFAGNRFDGTHASGAMEGPNGAVRWQFALEPHLPTLRPFPYAWMYRARIPEQKLTSPIPDAGVSGTLSIDGETIDLAGWRGMQGHNWGTRNTYRYAWCQAAGFEGADDVVFEGFSGRVRKAGIELPWATMAHLWIDGGWLRFDRAGAVAASRGLASVARWQFVAHAHGYTLEGQADAPHDQIVGLHYANPHDAMTYCLNSKLATLRLVLEGPSGRREFVTRQAALEIGWPSADHGVAMVA